MEDRFLMKDKAMNKGKGQVMLETSLVFVCMVLLLAGIINIWLWANKQIVERQMRYNSGRVDAGISSDTYQLKDHWPVYEPGGLTEDMVLKSPTPEPVPAGD